MSVKDKEISDNLTCFLIDEIDQKILEKMPEWFKIIREAKVKRY